MKTHSFEHLLKKKLTPLGQNRKFTSAFLKRLGHHFQRYFKRLKDVLIPVKTQKYGSTFVSNYSTSALIVKISVLSCRWPGWKWIASWKNEATFFKFIAFGSENSLQFWLRFIFSCKFTWYLPFSVAEVFCVRKRYVDLILGHFDPKAWKSPWRSPCKSSYFGKNDCFYQLFLKKRVLAKTHSIE